MKKFSENISRKCKLLCNLNLFNASFPMHIDCKFMLAITFVKKIHQSCIETMGVGFFNAGNCTVMQ